MAPTYTAWHDDLPDGSRRPVYALGALTADREGWVARARLPSLGDNLAAVGGLTRPGGGVPPDCVWLLYDIIRTDPGHGGHRVLDA